MVNGADLRAISPEIEPHSIMLLRTIFAWCCCYYYYYYYLIFLLFLFPHRIS